MNQGLDINSKKKTTHSSHYGHFHSDKAHRAWIAYIPDVPEPEKVETIKKEIEKFLDNNLKANKHKTEGHFLKLYNADKYNKVYYLDDTPKLLQSISNFYKEKKPELVKLIYSYKYFDDAVKQM